MHLRYVLLLVAALCPGYLHAAAWLQKQGKTQAIITARHLQSKHFTDWHGRKQAAPKLTQQNITPQLEYGLNPSTTLGGTLDLQRLDSNGANQSNLKQATFYTRHLLWQNASTVITFQPMVGIAGTYDEATQPRMGTKQTTLQGRLLLGHNLPALRVRGMSIPAFINTELGFSHTLPLGGQQVHADVTIGVQPAAKHMILAQSFNTFSLTESGAASPLQTNSEDYDQSTLQLSYIYQMTPSTRLQLGAFQHIRARNTGDGEGIFLSIWREF